MSGSMFMATHLDSKISLSLARVMIDTLRELSPQMRRRVDEKLGEEIRRLREEADVHFDVLSDAAATVIEHSYEAHNAPSASAREPLRAEQIA